MHPAGSRSATRLVASLLALAAVALAPVGLVWVARRRFGGASPWTGVDPPWQWHTAAIRDSLTNRLTESVIVDVILRVALAAVWIAVAVILVSVVAETVHMIRHGGMALPECAWSWLVATGRSLRGRRSDRGPPGHPCLASGGARAAGSRHDREYGGHRSSADPNWVGDARAASREQRRYQLHGAGGRLRV